MEIHSFLAFQRNWNANQAWKKSWYSGQFVQWLKSWYSLRDVLIVISPKGVNPCILCPSFSPLNWISPETRVNNEDKPSPHSVSRNSYIAMQCNALVRNAKRKRGLKLNQNATNFNFPGRKQTNKKVFYTSHLLNDSKGTATNIFIMNFTLESHKVNIMFQFWKKNVELINTKSIPYFQSQISLGI